MGQFHAVSLQKLAVPNPTLGRRHDPTGRYDKHHEHVQGLSGAITGLHRHGEGNEVEAGRGISLVVELFEPLLFRSPVRVR